MSELDEFMKREKPKRKSKLADYNKEIVSLKKNGYTIKQTHSYLTSIKKIEVNMEYLARHIRNLDLEKIEIFNESKQETAKPEPKKETLVQVVALKKIDQQQQEEKKDTATDADDILNYKADKDEDDMTPEELKIHRQKQIARSNAMMDKLKESPDYGKKKEVPVWQPTKMFADESTS